MLDTARDPRRRRAEDAPSPPEPRTFARRIDCARDDHAAPAAPPPARGGGRREPDEWERARRGLPY